MSAPFTGPRGISLLFIGSATAGPAWQGRGSLCHGGVGGVGVASPGLGGSQASPPPPFAPGRSRLGVNWTSHSTPE